MGKTNNILKTLFSSEVRINILSHFFMHPDEGYYIRQLEKILKKPVSNIQKELVKLEKIDLLSSSVEGNQKRYILKNEFPLYDELRNIFIKTTGLSDLIRDSLHLIKKIEFVFIYGSFATGDETSQSDVDLMIVGNVSDIIINKSIKEVEKQINRMINYSIYSKGEIEKRISANDNFIKTILEAPIILIIGNKDDKLFRIRKK
jgi:predicted nucleotidyltransferase